MCLQSRTVHVSGQHSILDRSVNQTEICHFHRRFKLMQCTAREGVNRFPGYKVELRSVSQKGGILLANPLQRSSSTFSWGSFLSFLPSKKACWAHQFRYLGVGQQYQGGFRDILALNINPHSEHFMRHFVVYTMNSFFLSTCRPASAGTFPITPVM